MLRVIVLPPQLPLLLDWFALRLDEPSDLAISAALFWGEVPADPLMNSRAANA